MTLSPHSRLERRRPQASLSEAVATWFGDMFRIYRDTFEAQRRFTFTVLQASASWSPLSPRSSEENVHNAQSSEGARGSARDAVGTSPRIVEQAPGPTQTATEQVPSEGGTAQDSDETVHEHGVSVADAEHPVDTEDRVDTEHRVDTEDRVDGGDRDDGEDEVESEDGANGEAEADVITPHASERGGRAARASGTKVRRAGTKSSSGPRGPRPAKRAQ